MIGRLNTSYKIFSIGLTMLLVAAASSANAQFLKKKSQKKDDDRSEYAYKTYSTTQRKEKKQGYGGSESRFHFEKPLAPTPYEKIDRVVDYSKAPFFGHKRIPIKRPPGSQKLCKVCGIMH